MSRVVPPPIEKNQNETGTTLSFLRSEAIHCTRKRPEKNAWPRNPTDSQRCSVVIMSVPSVSPRESTTCARWSAESALTRARIPAVHLTGEPIGPQENFAMRAIDKTLVDEVWRELTAYAPARVASEAQAFLELQPHAAAFSQSVTRAHDPAVQKAALGLGFLLFKVLEASLGRPFPQLAEDRILEAYALTQAWLAEHDGTAPAQLLEALEHGEHPSLPGYILSVFYEGAAASADYDDTVRASLFCLLKTLTDALDLAHVEEE